MTKRLFLRAGVITVLFTAATFAQTKIDLSTQTRNVDFSTSVATKPFVMGTAIPNTCSPGEAFFKSDAVPGENIFLCIATDSWSQVKGRPSTTTTGSVGGVVITSVGDLTSIDVDTTFTATQGGDNSFSGHNDFGGAASFKLPGGAGMPSPTECDSATEVGRVWLQYGGSATASALVTCQEKAAGVYDWGVAGYQQGVITPATCTVGQVFFNTAAPAGQNWLGCTAMDVWSVMGGGGGSAYQQGTTPPATCTIGQVFFNTAAPVGQNWLGCTATNLWSVMGVSPYSQGTSTPAACTVGQVFFNTAAPVGQNWLGCTATNVWSVMGVSPYSQGTTTPATCTVGQVFFNTAAPVGQNWLGCTATNVWSVMGVSPYSQGTTTPATCTVGQVFFNTATPVGQNWLGCTATDVWSVMGVSPYSQGTTTPATCTVGQVFFNTAETPGQNWLGCTSTNTWTKLGSGASLPTSAKGDLLVHNGTTNTVQTAGADGTILVADSTKSTGLTYRVPRSRAIRSQAGPSPTTPTSSTIIETYSIPAGILEAGDVIRITAQWTHGGNTNVPRIGLDFGSSVAIPESVGSASDSGYLMNCDVFIGSLSSESIRGTLMSGGNSVLRRSHVVNVTEDVSTGVALKFRANFNSGSAVDTVKLEWYLVEIIKGASL